MITPSATPLDSTLPAETPVSTSLLDDVSSEASVSSRASGTARTSIAPTNRISASTSTFTPVEATGGAVKMVGAGAAIIGGVMGFAGLF